MRRTNEINNMIKKIKFSIRLSILFIILIIVQYVNIEMKYDTYFQTIYKTAVFELKKTKTNFNDNEIELKRKEIYVENAKENLIGYQLRKFFFNLNDFDKELLIKEYNSELKENDNSGLNIKNQIKLKIENAKQGYNFISFIMEYILRFDSTKQLLFQNNYFYLVLTFMMFIFYTSIGLFNKFKN